MSREITHMKAFTAALESLGKPQFSIGRIPPSPDLVNQYFNDSTGVGDNGERDVRGPWNQGGDWAFVDAPAFKEYASQETGTRIATGDPEPSHVRAGTGKSRGNGKTAKKSSRH